MLSYKRIIDLNYCNSFKDINFLSYWSQLPKYGIIEGFYKFVKNMIAHLLFDLVHLRLIFKKNKIIFFYVTKNQLDSLKPVASLLSDSIFLTVHSKWKESYLVPMFVIYFFSFPFIFLLIFYVYKSKGYHRDSFTAFFEQYWLTFGYYYFFKIYLRITFPKAIVVANDHIPECRTLIFVAQELGIPTFYIQHASVSEKFPPLNFDYALLEGKDSLSKYSKAGEIKSKVFLIGMPKFDRYFPEINKSDRLEKLGICTNELDPLDGVSDIVKYFNKRFPAIELFLRPHPAETKKRKLIYQDFALSVSVRYSNPEAENTFEFLKKVDAIIACDSSILLEAALLNVYPIYYDYKHKNMDAYGYVKNGLADYVNNYKDLVTVIEQLINNKPYIRNRTKYYCETIGTENDGKSAVLAKNIIYFDLKDIQLDNIAKLNK